MATKRKERDSKVPDKVFLEPIPDITIYGSDEDPCFGKLYSLAAQECRICGDIELCAIAFAQKQSVRRLEVEAESNFKDLQEVKIFKDIENWFEEMINSGKNKKIIRIKAAKKYPKLTKEEINKYINQFS